MFCLNVILNTNPHVLFNTLWCRGDCLIYTHKMNCDYSAKLIVYISIWSSHLFLIKFSAWEFQSLLERIQMPFGNCHPHIFLWCWFFQLMFYFASIKFIAENTDILSLSLFRNKNKFAVSIALPNSVYLLNTERLHPNKEGLAQL